MRSIGNCKIGFRSANNFLTKKILLIAIAAAFAIYVIATSGPAGLVVLAIPLIFSGFLIMLNKRSLKVISFGDMFKKDYLDVLPLSISINPECFDLKISGAEIINRKVVDEIYHFKPNKNDELIYYKNSGLFKFNISSVDVSVISPNNKTVTRKLKKSLFGFYTHKKTGLEIAQELKTNGFNIFIAENEQTKNKIKEDNDENNK